MAMDRHDRSDERQNKADERQNRFDNRSDLSDERQDETSIRQDEAEIEMRELIAEQKRENLELWKKVRNVCITAIVVVALGCTAALFGISRESYIRAKQFCALNVARANDQVDRFDSTVEYLNSPEGQENTSINKVVRERSLPAIGSAVEFDRTHRAQLCIDLGRPVYKETKYPKVLEQVTADPRDELKKGYDGPH